MRNIYLLILGMLIAVLPLDLQAEEGTAALRRIGNEVASLKLGLGNYYLGQILSARQQKKAQENDIAKTIDGSYKFQDGDIFVIADKATDMVIGIYRENGQARREEVKKMVGELMLRFDEPTTMAHDKMIYWAFGKDGRIPEELFETSRATGGQEVLATVKFSSSVAIASPEIPEDKEEQKETKEEAPASIYVMVSSNPLSKIFLALNKH